MKKNNLYNNLRIYKIITLIISLLLSVILLLLIASIPDYIEYIFENGRIALISAHAVIVSVTLIIIALIDLITLKMLQSVTDELHQAPYLDKLTGIPNRYSCDLMFQNFDTPEHMKNIGCVLMMLDSLKEVNDIHGHETGNHLMADFSDLLSRTGSPYGFVGRNGGNEFLLIIEDCDNSKIDLFLLDFAKNAAAYNEKHPDTPIRISYTSLQNPAAGTDRFFEFITLVYKNFRTNAQKLL